MPNHSAGDLRVAAQRLLRTYAALAERKEHLLDGLLGGEAPKQWSHYPEGDAIDSENGYQWFYHAHSPEDRPGSAEHGHFHLFARRSLWAEWAHPEEEKAFAELTGNPERSADTRHLLSISLDAKGVPVSLFTVNSWVTGDLMLSAAGTERLLSWMRLDTGYTDIDTVLECVIALCSGEVRQVLTERDRLLADKAGSGQNILADESLEVLSEIAIELDGKLLSLAA